MLTAIEHPQISQILTLPGDNDAAWRADLERLRTGDVTLNRKTIGENSIKAIQRLFIFMGYSTSSTGAFSIDGDFGRGTNRAAAQFQFEHGLNPALAREQLCYPCTFQTARKEIVQIPDVTLDLPTLEKMLEKTQEAIQLGQLNCGSFEAALSHLNNLQTNSLGTCRAIAAQYGDMAKAAVDQIKKESGATVQPEWVLSIIRQETGGVVRPRFEQHLLSRFHRENPTADFTELRYRAMSFGLGQILGDNYKAVKAASAKAMFTSPLPEQVLFVARFLTGNGRMRAVVAKTNPVAADFHTIGRHYNGPAYETHHYHESIERWFKEFKGLLK
jgi:peptidoglycan hydrolase-like protein with peptidoglycan-binding domain